MNQAPTKLKHLCLKDVDLVADHAIFSKLLELIIGSDPVIGKHFAESGCSDLVVEAGIFGPNAVESAMNSKHYNNAVRMFKIMFEAFMRAKIDCFIEWIQDSSKDNYLVNFLESENFQNLLSKQDNESLKQCIARIMPIANHMDGYDEMLSDPTENGPSAAFWLSLISIIQIFLNFQKSIKAGNWQCCLGGTHMTGKTTAII